MLLRPLEAHHDRQSFDCDRDAMNEWFRRHALANQIEGSTRTVVLTDARTPNQVVGYVSLCSGSLDRTILPKPLQRNRPNPVPVTIIAQLAVDIGHQRKGHSLLLVRYAMEAALEAFQKVGSLLLLTQPLDDNACNFYDRLGFTELLNHPKRSMYLRMVDLPNFRP
jgi:ribosomal protein S18 acetylase RimI-like enzyme